MTVSEVGLIRSGPAWSGTRFVGFDGDRVFDARQEEREDSAVADGVLRGAEGEAAVVAADDS